MGHILINNLSDSKEFKEYAGVYTVDRLLGQGVLGPVFRIQDDLSKVYQAAKVLPNNILWDKEENQSIFDAFMGDLRNLENVDGLIKVLDIEFMKKTSLLRMQYPSGITEENVVSRSMRDFIRNRAMFFSEHEIAFTISSILTVLGGIHQAGCVHGNLKPSNIFFHQGSPVLGDCGLHHLTYPTIRAIALKGDGQSDSYISSSIPDYMRAHFRRLPFMSPESLNGEPASVVSDIYAIGILAQMLLTRTEEANVYDINEVCQGINPDWTEWIYYATHPNPEKRYQDVDTLRRAIPRPLQKEEFFTTINDTARKNDYQKVKATTKGLAMKNKLIGSSKKKPIYKIP